MEAEGFFDESLDSGAASGDNISNLGGDYSQFDSPTPDDDKKKYKRGTASRGMLHPRADYLKNYTQMQIEFFDEEDKESFELLRRIKG
ncbi:hypothetical protein KBG23_02915 [Candidatus Dojkabacteria bacterium]|jgi:hypothetical protein|nr:hypothetical protein [Candidatus Dojkabacteria bacterium]